MRKKKVGMAPNADMSLSRQCFNLADILLLTLDRDGSIIDINDKGLEILGYSKDELTGRGWFDTCIPENVRPQVKAIFKDIIEGRLELRERQQGRIVTKSGLIREILWKNAVLKDDKGLIIGTLSSGEDITERLEAEEALRKSENKSRSLFEAVHAGVIIQKHDGKIVFANTIAQQLFGMDEDDIIDADHNDERWKMVDEKENALSGDQHPSMLTLKTGKPVHGAIRGLFHGDKENFKWLLINTEPVFDDETGEMEEVIVTFNDVSRVKESEERWRRSEARLRSLVENAPNFIAIIDSEGVIHSLNRAEDNLEIENSLQTKVFDYLLPEYHDTVREVFKTVFETDKSGSYTAKASMLDRIVWYDTLVGPIYEDGKVVAATLISTDITDRLESEAEAQKHSELLTNFMENSPAVTFVKDTEGRYIMVNHVFEAVVDKRREEILGKTNDDLFKDSIHVARQMKDHDKIIIKSGKPMTFEEELPVKGTKRVFRTIMFPLRDESGTIYGIAGLSTDITDIRSLIKERERNLREINLKATETEALLEATRSVLTGVSFDEMVNGIFSICCKLVGTSASCLTTLAEDDSGIKMIYASETDSLCTMDSEMPGELQEICKRVLEKGSAEYRNSFSKGAIEMPLSSGLLKIKNAIFAPLLIEDKVAGVMGLAGKVEDFSEDDLRITQSFANILAISLKNKRDLQARRTSDEMLKAIFNSTNDTLALADKEMNFLMINENGAKRLGSTPENLAGKHASEVMKGQVGENRMARFREVLKTGRVVDFEDERLGKFFYTRLYPVFDDSGEVQWIAITAQDITYRKRIEDELLKTQKIESIGILAGGIAHDFNNLLTAIMSNVSLALSRMEKGTELFAALEDAEKASKRARDLTMQLLTFSRGGTPVKKVCQIGNIIREAVSLGLRGSNVQSEFGLPGDLWNVEVDRGQMSQVFNNLTINSKQAMPSGGTIRVTAKNMTIEDDSQLDLNPGKYVLIQFADEGIGIPHQYISRVFDPYFTTKQEGSGLGLATSYSIMMQHEGKIWLESELGKGTEFQLYLPATEIAVAEIVAEPKIEFKGEGKVLVMDDRPEIHKVTSRILGHLGLKSEFAFEGQEAIDEYRKAMESGAPFDLVIMDLTVPGGLGGKEAVKHLLEIDPEAKVIVSSGYSSDPIMSEYERFGFKGVIRKPYTVETFSDVIRKILDS